MLKQNIVEAIRNLVAARQRTLLALIGIVIGTGSVIAMVNIGTIVSAEALRQFEKLGTDLLQISVRDKGRKGRSITIAQSLALADDLPEIAVSAPIAFGGAGPVHQGRNLSATPVGTTEELFEIAKLEMEQGRFVNLLDGYGTFVVIGSATRREIAGRGGRIGLGDSVRMGNNHFTVIGLLPHVPFNSMIPLDLNASMILPIPVLKRLGARVQIQTILARTAPGHTPIGAEQAVREWFERNVPSQQPEVRSALDLIEQMQTQMQLYTLLLGAIGSISLVVGGVGVMNVMLVSVTERKQEIGIRMALGARRRDIRQLFLIESIVLSCLGGVIGTGFGVGTSALFAHFQSWQFVLATTAIPLGAGVSVAVGIFFGYYPAVMASRLNVVDALRAGG